MRRSPRREEVKQYTHDEQRRLNNPPVGLVTAETDRLNGKRDYEFDPHLDPRLQWAGRTEGTSFSVDTVSLHVHERIDPLTIIQAVRNKERQEQQALFGYFESKENNPPIRDAIEFYRHTQGWSNRLVAGDSLLVMNSLLEKEGMAGRIQMIYIDPPYGIKYGSNFQPFVNKKEVKDGKDSDLTQEPEMVKAFRDTWEFGIHSYLSYLRDRLLLARELLNDSGSIFVQIGDENVHHIKELLDEVFGKDNFISLIVLKKTSAPTDKFIPTVSDFILWYGRDRTKTKYHSLYLKKIPGDEGTSGYVWVELRDGSERKLTDNELVDHSILPEGSKVFAASDATSSHEYSLGKQPFEFRGRSFSPRGRYWTTSPEGMKKLASKNRLVVSGNSLFYKRYWNDFPYYPLSNIWTDTSSSWGQRIFVVQTTPKTIQRCLLMTTDPGDLVLDPTCGSGTTANVAEQWGRRWITCDTSRVAITLAKQRLMTSIFEYYELISAKEGVSSGFSYEKVPHITLRSIVNDEPPAMETVFDEPLTDTSKKRVTGPFTIEAVPSHRVNSLEELESSVREADASIQRSGETLRENDWIAELLSTGIRGKNGQVLEFARIEPLGGTRWIHAQAHTKEGKDAVISFGPPYSPLEQRQVELAIEEAQQLVPKPKLAVFASFQFDPEAAKDLDELRWPGVDVLKVQMNTDLLTSDLKKKRASNESFWLVGQPDIEVTKQGGKCQVVVNGFDYYNTKTGEIESGDASKIAMWELDTDYDGRSLYPRQVFFPMSGQDGGWTTLAKNLKAEIDEELINVYRGNKSLPFALGSNNQIAVKIIDDRGIESLKVVKVRE